MSIVRYISEELPKEGALVFCDNGKRPSDMAYFTGGEFIGGGDFPMREYKMKHVTKWFYMDEYSLYFKERGKNSYLVSFKTAESMVV